MVAQLQQADIVGNMQRGAQAGDFMREAGRRNKLYDLYASSGGQIMAGNQPAINKLAQIDPGLASQYQDRAQEGQAKRMGTIAAAAYGVKTPEEFEMAKGSLVQMGVLSQDDAAQYTFEQLPAIIAASRGVEGQILDERDLRDFQTGVDQWNATFDQRGQQLVQQQANSDRTFGLQQQQFAAGREDADRNYQLQQQRLQAQQAAAAQKAAEKERSASLQDVKGESDLRKEWNAIPQVRAFSKQSQAYGRIVNSARDPSPAGDLSLIFNYMKILDPGSVVRESEFATAAKASAWLQESEETGVTIPRPIAYAIRQMSTGQRLSPEQRDDFVGSAKALYDGARQDVDNLRSQYEGIANTYGFEPSRTITDFSTTIEPDAAAATVGGSDFDMSGYTDEQLQAIINGQ